MPTAASRIARMSVSSSESQSSTLTQGVIDPALKGVNFAGDASTLRGGLTISTRFPL